MSEWLTCLRCGRPVESLTACVCLTEGETKIAMGSDTPPSILRPRVTSSAEPLPGVATTQPITDPKHVVRGTLAFFRSCIRCGEEYDATCERAYDRAMAALELLS